MLNITPGVPAQNAVINAYTVVRALFEQNGNPVKVTGTSFHIYDSQNNELSVTTLYPPRENYPDIGYVQVAFDPTQTITSPGKYTLKFKATSTVDGSELFVSQDVTFGEVSREQWFVDELRIALMDNITTTEFVPSRFLIRQPNELMWEDEELYSYLVRALNDVNNASPPTITFTLQNVPCANFVILGGMIYALLARGLVEVYNWYETNAPVNVRIYKGDKFKDFMNWVENSYRQPLLQWKKSWSYYSATHRLLVLTKLPFRVIKPLSMLFGYHNFFTG